MSFLRSCCPCLHCCLGNAYEKVTEKSRESPYEMIEKSSFRGGKKSSLSTGTRQPLLHSTSGEAFQAAPSLKQRQSSQNGGKTYRQTSLQTSSTPSSPSLKKPYFELDQELPEDVRSLPTLQFSVLSDVQDQSLIVNLQEAFNLPTEAKKSCNPSVAVYIIPQTDKTFATEPRFNTTSPKWNRSFKFPKQPIEVLQKQTLVFRVYNRQEDYRNDPIGVVLLPLAQAELYGVPVRMTIKKDRAEFGIDSTGGLLLSLNHLPDKGLLSGRVMAAHNLKKRELFQRDPYVKVLLLYNGERLFKWKTSVRKNTCLPVFDEPFNFNISGLDLSDITLHFIVMDHDTFSRDELIGTVLVGGDVEHKSGRIQWSQMLASPNTYVRRWHMIESPDASGLPDLPEEQQIHL